MTAAEKLYQLIQVLPEQQVAEVLTFAEFLQHKKQVASSPPSDTTTDQKRTADSKQAAIQSMRGLLKTEQPTPTDQDISMLLEERRREKFDL